MTNIVELDKKYIWHPFTNLKFQDRQKLLNIVKGKGLYVWDEDGNKYIDAIGSWWTQIHGHSHPRLVAALKEQVEVLDQIHFAGNTHRWAVETAQRVLEKLGHDFTKAFYSDDGSTAVEVAIKMAYQYYLNIGEKRKYFVSLSRAYHGDTLGGISLGGIEDYHEIFGDLTFKVFHGDIDKFEEVESIIEKYNTQIVGIIVEPLLMGAAGMKIYSIEKLHRLRELADKYNILLIFDEVFTGFGRTGEMFAFQHSKISPDIICLGKGLGGGMLTIAMTCTKDFIFEAYKNGPYPYLNHGHTFTANPIVCRLAIESLNLFDELDLINQVKQKSKVFENKLKEKFSDFSQISNIRNIGLVGAFDINIKKEQIYEVMPKIINKGLDNGIMLRNIWNTIYFIPYLHITEEEIELMLELTRKSLKDIII